MELIHTRETRLLREANVAVVLMSRSRPVRVSLRRIDCRWRGRQWDEGSIRTTRPLCSAQVFERMKATACRKRHFHQWVENCAGRSFQKTAATIRVNSCPFVVKKSYAWIRGLYRRISISADSCRCRSASYSANDFLTRAHSRTADSRCSRNAEATLASSSCCPAMSPL